MSQFMLDVGKWLVVMALFALLGAILYEIGVFSEEDAALFAVGVGLFCAGVMIGFQQRRQP